MATAHSRPAPTQTELENWLEARLRRKIRICGGRLYKLAPTVKGMPDRLVIMPGARMFLVELKAEFGALSPRQKIVHAEMAALGIYVHVLTGPTQIDNWVLKQAGYLEDQENTRTYRRRKA